MMMTTALEKVFGCQQPPSGVPAPLKAVESVIGGMAQVDFESRTRRVRRKPLVKKYMPVTCIKL
jgi:hypothetical protein